MVGKVFRELRVPKDNLDQLVVKVELDKRDQLVRRELTVYLDQKEKKESLLVCSLEIPNLHIIANR